MLFKKEIQYILPKQIWVHDIEVTSVSNVKNSKLIKQKIEGKGQVFQA